MPRCHSLILAADIKIQYADQQKNSEAFKLFTTKPAKKRLWGKPPDSGSLGSEVDDDVSEGKYKLDSDAEEDEKKKRWKWNRDNLII